MRPPTAYPRSEYQPHRAPLPIRTGIPRPLQTPPEPSSLPDLPVASRKSTLFGGTFSLSTHIFPAAYPRTHPHFPPPDLSTGINDNKETRRGLIKKTANEILQARISYETNQFNGVPESSKPLWICINRYVRRQHGKGTQNRAGLTLFFAHAVGFCKEVLEPTMSKLVTELESDPSAPVIDEIWCMDSVQHGDSALLNSGNLSCLFDWTDQSRDFLHFLQYYMPETAFVDLPTHLNRLPDSIASLRQKSGFSHRNVVGVGHSFGSQTMLLSAIKCPALWSSLVMIDPVYSPYIRERHELESSMRDTIGSSIGRRSYWKTRDVAYSSLKNGPVASAWDPAVLRAFVEHALYDDPVTGGVRLKTTPVQESVLYDPRSQIEIWQLIPSLDKRIGLFWIMSQESGSGMWLKRFGERINEQLVWLRPENSRNIVLDCGHLIPMQKPNELAREIASFVVSEYGTTPASSGAQARL